ncbi:MAG: hypothetical protein AB1773_13820 [Pseudomonadota bacterium]
MRPKVKFVTVVWGETYLERFARLSLPSFLAPGNLPALAAATELEVVIATLRGDVETLRQHAACRRLHALCGVRFIAIDDLVTGGVYGVTLTLAYARVVIGCGADMVNTHFVFMNADFVLAEGSLRALSKHILAGRRIVLAPSFRAAAETLEPVLLEEVDRTTHVLAMAPRKMVGLAQRHPHPTTLAKIVNQGVLRTRHPNQLFWQVDEHTLLGRYFLAFMLCLKPERVVTAVNSYCDYGFIPEMCPSGDEVMMGDSDEFFLLELQRWDSEKSLLRFGPVSERKIVADLSRWTTAEHRRAARYDVVFHGRDLPEEISRARAQTDAFVERLLAQMAPPRPHAFHRFWVEGVWHWANRARGPLRWPPELEWGWPLRGRKLADRLRFARYTAIALCKLIIKRAVLAVSRFVARSRLDPRWPDWQLLQAGLKTICEAGGRPVLVVTSAPATLEPFLRSRSDAHVLTPDRLWQFETRAGGLGPRHALLHLLGTELDQAPLLLERCRALVAKEGTFQLYIQSLDWGNYAGLTEAQSRFLASIASWQAEGAQLLAAGSRIRQALARALRVVQGAGFASRPRAVIQAIPLLLVLPWLAALSLLRRSPIRRRFGPGCSSLLIRFEGGRAHASRMPVQHSAIVPKASERTG